MSIIPLCGLFLFLCLSSCKKNSGGYKCDTNFEIYSTQTPYSATVTGGFRSFIKAYGPNGCCTFTNSDVKQVAPTVYEIRLMGKTQCDSIGCADILISANDTISLYPQIPAIYMLRFYNGGSLFKTDTVTVN